VVGVHAGTVRDNQHIVSRGHSYYALGFRNATQPGNVGLQNLHALARNELAEAITSVLVLTSGQIYAAAQSIMNFFVTVVVILFIAHQIIKILKNDTKSSNRC
jgi:hypothetical protein